MMTPEDALFIERCQTTLADLHATYDDLDLSLEEKQENLNHRDIYLEILTCETIIDECKAEVDSSSLEEIEANLNLVYHMDLDQHDGHENTLVKLDQVASKFLSSQKYKQDVDEKLLAHHREDMDLILGIKEVLQDRLFILRQEKRWFFFPKTIAIHKYEKVLQEFETVEVEIRENFTRISEIITTYIVESFHYIYLYFSYVIKYFFYTDNQLVLVEIAATIDRFINVMQPLVKTTTLKNENLRNFYVIYEFKVLKDLIIEHYE
jgi:hypothetical protein